MSIVNKITGNINASIIIDNKLAALLKLAEAKKYAIEVGALVPTPIMPAPASCSKEEETLPAPAPSIVVEEMPAPVPETKWTAPDGIGFVELLDTFGDDLTVVNAARVSFAKESTAMSERDGKLIKYLADHDHVTPFFHPQARFRIKLPIFVAREWYRHQIGFARNEVSRRYVDSRPECWTPAVEDIRARDPRAKQGSRAEPADGADGWSAAIGAHNERAVALYEELLAGGVAPEVARTVLPLGMYTEFIETGSLAAYARLCGLRLGPDAQREIQAYAGAVSRLMTARFPASWAALSS
jgi:thymidylate synthase (FAD)